MKPEIASTNWNELYETGATPWDKGLPTPVLAEVQQRHPQLFQGEVMVPGCGTGSDARWLAAQGCRTTGVDIAPLAVDRARSLDAGQGVQYVLASLFDLPEELRGKFDLVWEHTCLCALDPALRKAYIQGVAAALKVEGHVAGVFFIDPEMDPGETGPPFGISPEELTGLWEEAGFRVQESWVPTTGYSGRVGRERVLIAVKAAKAVKAE
ncbi:methyltransferase domain-containing protein [Verrucomicrobium spinosum]|uniref:methyltransferase domain-containing protein n=1 Tax=Verrucomicrobium spinosum TaxID=2736 RepID=UPI0001744630|nr:methyltransferase domain-containing protein [Verrucomicrobium spinosum]